MGIPYGDDTERTAEKMNIWTIWKPNDSVERKSSGRGTGCMCYGA